MWYRDRGLSSEILPGIKQGWNGGEEKLLSLQAWEEVRH